jgi:hypothetical protein
VKDKLFFTILDDSLYAEFNDGDGNYWIREIFDEDLGVVAFKVGGHVKHHDARFLLPEVFLDISDAIEAAQRHYQDKE